MSPIVHCHFNIFGKPWDVQFTTLSMLDFYCNSPASTSKGSWSLFSLIIFIRSGKVVWKHGPYCWYFCLNVKYLGWPYRAYIKTVKNGNFCEELLSENGFEAVLATFCCYDHGAKASEAVQKIAADQKEYRKCSLCAVICWIAKIYLPIWLLQGYLRRS